MRMNSTIINAMKTNNTNFKYQFLALCSILILLVTVGCKKPQASFVLKKYDYAAGDMLEIENTSLSGKGYYWEVLSVDGTVVDSSESKNPALVLGLMIPDGVYTVKLAARSQNGKRGTIDEKSFMVKTIRGNLSVSGNGQDYKKYDVFVDDQLVGKADYSGNFYAKIPIGLRYIKVVGESKVKVQTAEIKSDYTTYVYYY